MLIIKNAKDNYSLLTHSAANTVTVDKKNDNILIKQLFSIKMSSDKNISIRNNNGNMEINILYSKKKLGLPSLFSISTQKKVIITSEKCKEVTLTPSKDPNNKMGIDIKLISDQPSS